MPILLSLGPVKIYSYGVCMAIGIFLSLYWWWKLGRDEHFDEIMLFDAFFLATITYFIAGRVGYVLLHFRELGTLYRSLAILAYPGINVIAGIVASIGFVVMFARSQSWETWKVIDSMVVTLSIALVFGSIGGLLNGSGINRYVDWWSFGWALMTFLVVSRVRKNFRFYSWYKGETSTVAEGLAGHVFLLLIGVFFSVRVWLSVANWMVWRIPGEFLIGLSLILVSVGMVKQRVGKRDLGWWEEFRQWRLNLLQSMRRRRI